MRSFAQVAAEGPKEDPKDRSSPTFVVADSKCFRPRPLVSASATACSTPYCNSKKFPDEKFCFDCLQKVGKECDNFSICGGYHAGPGIDGKIASTLCRTCYKDMFSKCENFETCGNQAYFDKGTKTYQKQCSLCYKEQASRCKNYGVKCEGHTRYDHENRCRYEMCSDCYKDLVSRCRNFETCGDRRFFSAALGKYNYFCRQCFEANKNPVVE